MDGTTSISIKEWGVSQAAPAEPFQKEQTRMYSDHAESGKIRVAVRVRQLVEREVLDGAAPCLHVDEASNCITASSRQAQQHRFTFDHVFGPNSSKGQVYDACVSGSLEAFFDGYNATVLAYGQTGGGKTYTLTEIIPQVARDLFKAVQTREASGAYCQVSMQYVELYNEELRDLLAPPRTLQGTLHSDVGFSTAMAGQSACGGIVPSPSGGMLSIREAPGGEIFLEGAAEVVVTSEGQFLSMVATGNAARSTGATSMNELSSRSHAILIVTLQQQLSPCPTTGEVDLLCAKLHLVDLAGSERTKRSRVAGVRLREAVNINQGLLGLGNVISALGDETKRGGHVPYRDSKLTRLLQDSLGGNSVTTMIACVSCADDSIDETLNTLKYANRARNIRNRPKVNRDSLAGLGGLAEQQALAFLQQVVSYISPSNNSSVLLREVLEAPQLGSKACVAALGQLAQAVAGMDPEAAQQLQGSCRDADLDRLLADKDGLELRLAGCSRAAAEVAAMLGQLEVSGQLTQAARTQIMQSISQMQQHAAQPGSRLPGFGGAASITSHPVSCLTDSMQSLNLLHGASETSDRSPAGPVPVSSPRHLQNQVADLEARLASCSAELAGTCAELALAKDDLERDEVVFAAKVDEISGLQQQLAEATHAAWVQREDFETMVSELRRELAASGASQQGSLQPDARQQQCKLTGVVDAAVARGLVGSATAADAAVTPPPPLPGSSSPPVSSLPQGSPRYRQRYQCSRSSLGGDEEVVLYDDDAHSFFSDSDHASVSKASAAPLAAELAAAVEQQQQQPLVQEQQQQLWQEQQQQHEAEKRALEGQIAELAAGIQQREALIEELHVAEAQARSASSMYQAQLQALQQALAAKEADLGVLHLELAALGGDRARGEQDSAALRQQYEERIALANSKLAELRRRLREQEAARVSQEPPSARAEKLREDLARLKAQQSALKGELAAKVHAHERQAQLQARELAGLRKAAEAAQRAMRKLEAESSRQRAVIKKEAEVAASSRQILELSRRQRAAAVPGLGGSSSSRRTTQSVPSSPGACYMGFADPRHAAQPLSARAPRAASMWRPKPPTATSAASPMAGRPSVPAAAPLAPPHQRWLEHLLDATSAQRQAEVRVWAATRQAAALRAQRARVDAERCRLEQRLRQRLQESRACMGQLLARRGQLLQQLELGARQQQQEAQQQQQEGFQVFGELAQAAQEVEEEAQREELQRCLKEVEGQVQQLQAACSSGGAWTQLQQHQQQLLEKLDGLVQQLDNRLAEADAQARLQEEARHRAEVAAQLLRRRPPNMTLPEMRKAVLLLVDVVATQAVDASTTDMAAAPAEQQQRPGRVAAAASAAVDPAPAAAAAAADRGPVPVAENGTEQALDAGAEAGREGAVDTSSTRHVQAQQTGPNQGDLPPSCPPCPSGPPGPMGMPPSVAALESSACTHFLHVRPVRCKGASVRRLSSGSGSGFGIARNPGSTMVVVPAAALQKPLEHGFSGLAAGNRGVEEGFRFGIAHPTGQGAQMAYPEVMGLQPWQPQVYVQPSSQSAAEFTAELSPSQDGQFEGQPLPKQALAEAAESQASQQNVADLTAGSWNVMGCSAGRGEGSAAGAAAGADLGQSRPGEAAAEGEAGLGQGRASEAAAAAAEEEEAGVGQGRAGEAVRDAQAEQWQPVRAPQGRIQLSSHSLATTSIDADGLLRSSCCVLQPLAWQAAASEEAGRQPQVWQQELVQQQQGGQCAGRSLHDSISSHSSPFPRAVGSSDGHGEPPAPVASETKLQPSNPASGTAPLPLPSLAAAAAGVQAMLPAAAAAAASGGAGRHLHLARRRLSILSGLP